MTKNGPKMDQKWTRNGPKMNQTADTKMYRLVQKWT